MMHFLYASDETFSGVLKASLHSLLVTHVGSPITVHIIGDGLSARTVESVQTLAGGFDQSVNFIEMPDFERIFGRPIDTKRFSLSALSRLFAGSLIDRDVERIIYLDCDTIVATNLSRLWSFDLGSGILGAVNDCRNWRYLRHLGLSRDSIYVNSGVLLMDLAKLRAEDWEGRFRDAVIAYDGVLEFPDNDLICMFMQEHLVVLPPEFNVISPVRMCDFDEVLALRRPTVYYDRSEFEAMKARPAILHYTTFFGVQGRPWCHGYDEEDGTAFRRHFVATGGALRPIRDGGRIRRWSAGALKGPLRPVALRAFGLVHSVVKPSLDRTRRRQIRRLQDGDAA